MRIIIAHNYSPTSFSVISWCLARRLANQGHEVLFFSHQPNPTTPDKSQKGLTLVGWPQKRPTGISSFLHYYKLHRSFNPDLVILHFAPQFVAGIAAWLLGCPNRWGYYHTAEAANIVDTAQNPVLNKLRRIRKSLLYRTFTRIICVSQFAKDDIQRYFKVAPKKLEVVYNALPDRWDKQIEKQPDGPVIFHLLGRLDPCKRVLELTAAFQTFKKETGFPAILRIAGAGLLEQKLKQNIEGDPNISYLGSFPYAAVDAFIAEAHYLICPSLVETFGMVNAESVMNATPVLASNAGGIPEIIVDGETGFLSGGMEEKHWVALFKKACLFVKDKPGEYAVMQENCRTKYLQQFSIEKYLSIMENKILQLKNA